MCLLRSGASMHDYAFWFQKHGKSARNAKKGQNPEAQEEEYKKCPHSFVFHWGLVGKNVKRLTMDMRHVMEPYTALNLKVCLSL